MVTQPVVGPSQFFSASTPCVVLRMLQGGEHGQGVRMRPGAELAELPAAAHPTLPCDMDRGVTRGSFQVKEK